MRRGETSPGHLIVQLAPAAQWNVQRPLQMRSHVPVLQVTQAPSPKESVQELAVHPDGMPAPENENEQTVLQDVLEPAGHMAGGRKSA